MNLQQLTVTGPFTHENLSLFLLRGTDSFDGSRFIPLDEALEQKSVIVHETGNVGQLEVENLSDVFDLYAQAGDVVKGGRQDRTLGVDFVLPAKSGRVPVPSFCVESGRWRRRASEDVHAFGSSKAYLASKNLRMAAKFSKSQHEVWEKVAETQQHLSASLGESLYDTASPTSYQLTVENEDLQKRKETYGAAFARILDDAPDALGYAFVINGDAAVLEAIAESRRQPEQSPAPVTADSIRAWFGEADSGEVLERREVPPRVRMETRRSRKSVLFDTCDHALEDAVLHRNLVAN